MGGSRNKKQKIKVITTGGTIEKTYDEVDGSLSNKGSSIDREVISRLRLPYTKLSIFSILMKDSLTMNDDDRELLAQTIEHHLSKKDPIVVLHGTDTMEVSARYCFEKIAALKVVSPVVFTGAMLPFGFRESDAKQNISEALMAAQILPPGFYISFHNRIFNVPDVRKNREKSRFEAF